MTRNFVMNKKARVLFPSTADVIQVECSTNRLRAFYTTGQAQCYTLKIVCDSDRRKVTEEMKREVAVREQLASLKTINIPRVLGTEHRKDAFLLSEEMILGRRFNPRTDKTVFRKSLLPQLRATYKAYGVRYAPVQTFLPPDKIQKVIGLVRESTNGERFTKALQDVIAGNGLVSVSLCHGGLGPGNLAIVNDTVVFLDWQKAYEGMIIVDLLATAVKYPKHSYRFNDIREFMTPDFIDNSCRFEELLTARTAVELLRRPTNNIAKRLRNWQHQVLSKPAT